MAQLQIDVAHLCAHLGLPLPSASSAPHVLANLARAVEDGPGVPLPQPTPGASFRDEILALHGLGEGSPPPGTAGKSKTKHAAGGETKEQRRERRDKEKRRKEDKARRKEGKGRPEGEAGGGNNDEWEVVDGE